MAPSSRTLILVSSLQANWAIFDAFGAWRVALRKTKPYLIVAIVSALFLFPFMRLLAPAPDEGSYLYGAQRAAEGALPGRDFIELNPPAAYYWLAMFFKIFGTSMMTARTVLLLTGVGMGLLVFHLSRRLGASGIFATIFVVTTSIPLMIMNSPHYDTNLFGLLALAVFLSAQARLDSPSGLPVADSQSPSRLAGTHELLLFAAGILTGLVSCFIQQKGMYFAAAFGLSLIVLHRKNRFRLATILSAGYCCPVAIELLLYARAKALPDLIYANLILPLSTYHDFNAVPYGFPLWQVWIPKWLALIRASSSSVIGIFGSFALVVPWIFILLLPLLPILGYFCKMRAFRRELLPYWLTAYAVWFSESHRLDMGHLKNACIILVILFFAMCETHAKAYLRHLAVAITGCVILIAVANVIGAVAAKAVIHTRRGTLVARQEDKALQFLLTHTQPGENVFVYPYHAMYYFLADVRNPTRFSALMYVPNTNFLFREAVRDVDSKKVRYVLWDTVFAGENLRSVFPAYHPPTPDKLIMEPYLQTHYRQIGFENGFRILERTQ